MTTTKIVWKMSASGPLVLIGWSSSEHLGVAPLDQGIAADNDQHQRHQQQDRDGSAERPVQRIEKFVISERRRDLEPAAADDRRRRKRARGQREHDDRPRQYAR